LKNPFEIGDQKVYERTVLAEDQAAFESGLVHPVYSTFALARDAEWACRLFVLEMKEEDEEGIGSFIDVQHQSPAPVGAAVRVIATLEEVEGNRVLCSYEVFQDSRLIANGRQEQRILKKTKIDSIFAAAKLPSR
jgi:predicted thioesterase